VKSSPYNCTQGGLSANNIIKGNRRDPENTFQWDHTEENLPCSSIYNAALPEVQKLRKDGDTAFDIVQYIGDARTLASTEEQLWLAQSKMVKMLSYLGLQDAACKRRMGSRPPGAWAGAVVSTDSGVVMKSVLRDCWSKTQEKVQWIAKYLNLVDEYTSINEEGTTEGRPNCPDGEIPFKDLERVVGFLVYVSKTYTYMVPYLKGIYLTLNSWREGRDKMGWKILKQQRDEAQALDGPAPSLLNVLLAWNAMLML